MADPRQYEALERTVAVRGPLDLRATLRPLADSDSDPCWVFERDGAATRVVRALWTPVGPATVEVRHDREELSSYARGPGAGWVTDRVDWMCGARDEPGVPTSGLHPAVRAAVAERPGLRMGRSLVLWDVVVPTLLGQRVTTAEARRSWRGLVARHGHGAPGSDEVLLPPTPEQVIRLGDADWHRLGVERRRVDAIRGVARILAALERPAGVSAPPEMPSVPRTAEFRRVVESVPGVGRWSSTSLAISVLGDPDEVLLGDLHVPHGVCNVLAGEPRGGDARMLELLEPFRPQRGRVVRLLTATGRAAAPRRAPRYSPLPIRDL